MVKEEGVGGAEGVCREQGSSVKVGCLPPPPTSFLPVSPSSVPLFPLYYPSLDTACFAQPCYDLLSRGVVGTFSLCVFLFVCFFPPQISSSSSSCLLIDELGRVIFVQLQRRSGLGVNGSSAASVYSQCGKHRVPPLGRIQYWSPQPPPPPLSLSLRSGPWAFKA